MSEFKPQYGKVYVCKLRERPDYFNSDGEMDYFLTGAPFKLVEKGVSNHHRYIFCNGTDSGCSWMFKSKDIMEISDWKTMVAQK